MISDLLKDLNVDCNFTNDIKESKYTEGSKNDNMDTSINTTKQDYYPTFIKCIISELKPSPNSII